MIWSIPVIGATIGGLVVAILFHRAMETRRRKKYVRESMHKHQPVHVHPLPKLERGSILVLFSDLEYPDYQAMEHSLLCHAEKVGSEIASMVYRRQDDDEAQVIG